jgi:predicted TIM-barrel fold metal-dependent hydrolase
MDEGATQAEAADDGFTATPPDPAVPAGAWDCHVHVFGDRARYPLGPERHYTPALATDAHLEKMLERIGFDHAVLVQPSAYGTDNRCLLDALAAFGRRSRAIAVIGPDTPERELRALDAAGVRGVRINAPRDTPASLAARIDAFRPVLPAMAELGWNLQFFAGPSHFELLERFCRAEPVAVVIDHAGGQPDAAESLDGRVQSLRRLLGTGRCWIKLSGAYRVGAFGTPEGQARLVAALAAENPEHLLWGSDWPHTASHEHKPVGGAAVHPFRKLDTGLLTGNFLRAVADDPLRRRILVENPARLFGRDG